MFTYTAAGVFNGFETDETFGTCGVEITQSEFDMLLAAYGYNEADIESLGYEEIVRRINASC